MSDVHWYALWTRSRHEQVVREQLERLEVLHRLEELVAVLEQDRLAHAHADHDLRQTRQRMHVSAPQSTLEVRYNSIFVILYQPRHTEHSSLITAIRPHTTCTSSNNFAGQ